MFQIEIVRHHVRERCIDVLVACEAKHHDYASVTTYPRMTPAAARIGWRNSMLNSTIGPTAQSVQGARRSVRSSQSSRSRLVGGTLPFVYAQGKAFPCGSMKRKPRPAAQRRPGAATAGWRKSG